MLYALVTLYKPQPEHLENIKKLATIDGIDGVIVMQNCETPISAGALGRYVPIQNHNEGGLGGAFNRGAQDAFRRGADRLLFLDQDSNLPADFARKMLEFMDQQHAQIAAPDFIDVNSNTRGTFGRYEGKFKYVIDRSDALMVRSHSAIMSGSMISKKAFEEIGLFDEHMLVDHVDTEYFLRAHQKHIDIFVNRQMVIEHAIGHRSMHRLFGVLTVKPTHHSVYRRYLMTRNGVELIRRYLFRNPAFAKVAFKRIVHDVLGVVFYETEKSRKLLVMLKGIWIGIFS